MSKNDKTLLSESITSRMMKLANVKKTLRENFITDRYLEEEEDEMEVEMGAPPEDEDAAPVGGDEMGMGDEMPAPEGEMAGGEMGESQVETLVSAIADAIQSVTGVEVDVEGGEGGEEMPAGDEMPEPDMAGDEGGEAMPPAEEMPPEEEVMEGLETQGGNKHKGSSPDPVKHKNKKVGDAGLASQGPGLVKEEEKEEEEDDQMAESTERFVEEITRRVAARLLNTKK